MPTLLNPQTHLWIKSTHGVNQTILPHASAVRFGLAAHPPTGPPLLNFLIHVEIYPSARWFIPPAFVRPPSSFRLLAPPQSPSVWKLKRPSQTDAERKCNFTPQQAASLRRAERVIDALCVYTSNSSSASGEFWCWKHANLSITVRMIQTWIPRNTGYLRTYSGQDCCLQSVILVKERLEECL